VSTVTIEQVATRDDPVDATEAGPPERGGLISFRNAEFVYDPYPMGVVTPVFAEGVYEQLVEEFPPIEDFVFKPHLGNKYSLSEVNNPHLFHRDIKARPLWHDLFQEVKSRQFIDDVIETLGSHNLELGLERPGRGRVEHGRHFFGRFRRRQIDFEEFVRHMTHRPRKTGLTSRFEFSMLPADGGHIKPHTDAPQKHITLIFSMVRDGEWDPRHGGGTDMQRPRDMSRNYNHLNEQFEFEEMENIRTFPFLPNQCVVFVKTFNSWHSVPPMTGPPGVMRRTLTINIESAGMV
jgi:hypothetical protein